jgi:nucleoside 2-deoxyribosyltransferase
MATCFVIQPFDSGKFDKRFHDIYKPAIEAAGLEAYRVDQDPGVQIPIDSIEKGIRQAAVCLADITADNPNVWYELGFAYAASKPVVMVCSEERTGKKYPFDIQHRSIIPYLADAPSDFEKLRASLTAKIEAIVKQDAVLEKIAEESPVTPVHGLSPPEILVLAVVAGDAYLPDQATTVNSAKRAAERAGVTNMGFNLAVRRLLQKKFIREHEFYNEQDGETYAGLAVADLGWDWIDANEAQFVLTRPDKKEGEIPF